MGPWEGPFFENKKVKENRLNGQSEPKYLLSYFRSLKESYSEQLANALITAVFLSLQCVKIHSDILVLQDVNDLNCNL